jgi:hypothetical protein
LSRFRKEGTDMDMHRENAYLVLCYKTRKINIRRLQLIFCRIIVSGGKNLRIGGHIFVVPSCLKMRKTKTNDDTKTL